MIQTNVPFEIHITTEKINKTQHNDFINFCTINKGKPLIIELAQGEFSNQPMFSKIIYSKQVEDVLNISSNLSIRLSENHFYPKRIKIEVPSIYANLFQNYNNDLEKYFEWHGKITYVEQEKLYELCRKYKVHLSINSLKDEQEKRFITLREYGEQHIFEQRVATLIEEIKRGNWDISKQQSEYCIYDTNQLLDNGWLNN